MAAVQTLELDVELVCQPPNSPDLNVLDLGFFNAKQSLQYKSSPKNIDELVEAVEKSFQKLHQSNLNNVFLILQKVMKTCILGDDDNSYKLPHMSKKHWKKG